MDLTTRELTGDDFEQGLRLATEAFGGLPRGVPAPSPATWPGAGRHHVGTFDGDRLVARIMRRDYDSWFGGAAVPTTGVAAVTVAAEHRGRGLLDELFRVVLDAGRERGDLVSTLFPTAPGIYRRFGYEVVGSLDSVEVPTAGLTRVPAPSGIALRRAVEADFDAVRGVYDAWARAQNGPLTRRGPSFEASAADFVGAFTGVTVAVDDYGQIVGFVSWDRGEGYGPDACIEVVDLLAVSGPAWAALWRFLGGFASVAERVRVRTSGADLAWTFLPSGSSRLVRSQPYMLRVADVCGALTGLPPTDPAALTAAARPVAFAVAGDLLGHLDGHYRVAADHTGTARCRPADPGPDVPVLTPRGLALAYAGAQSSAALRLAGLLTGPTTHDTFFDALGRNRAFHIRDYF